MAGSTKNYFLKTSEMMVGTGLFSGLCSFSLVALRLQELLEDDCVVVLRIMGTVYQSHCALAGGLQKEFPGFWFGHEFSAVTAPEFTPFRGIVTEPFS